MASVCGGSLVMMDAGVADQGGGRRRGDGPRHGREDGQARRPHARPLVPSLNRFLSAENLVIRETTPGAVCTSPVTDVLLATT